MPKALGRALIGHEWSTVRKLRWEGTQNGALLTRAEKAGFDVLVAFDGSMGAELNMTNRKIAILVLRPREQGNEPARAGGDRAGRDPRRPAQRPGLSAQVF